MDPTSSCSPSAQHDDPKQRHGHQVANRKGGIALQRFMIALLLVCAVGIARSPVGAQAQVPDLGQLHQALLATPFDDAELPPGFSGAQLQDVPIEAAGAAAGELANIDLTVERGPDPINARAYTFYTTADQAQTALSGVLLAAGLNVQVAEVLALKGYGVPATYIACVLLDPPTGVSACALQVGSIIVAAYSAAPNQASGNPDNACGLAVAMQAHLQRLLR
jgi:hypothetical protein